MQKLLESKVVQMAAESRTINAIFTIGYLLAVGLTFQGICFGFRFVVNTIQGLF